MDGYINAYFNIFDQFLAALIHSFKKFDITLHNPKSKEIRIVEYEGTNTKVSLEKLLDLSQCINSEYLNIKFWIAANSDVFTSIKRRYDIFEFVFYVDGLEEKEIDQVELAVNDFIKENRSNFLLKIVDPKGYHEEIDWFEVMLTQYNLPDKE